MTPFRMDKPPAVGLHHPDDLARPSSGMIVAMALTGDKMAEGDM